MKKVTYHKRNSLVIKMIPMLIILVIVLTACGNNSGTSSKTGPEVGKWHAEVKVNDLMGDMSQEDRMIMSLLAGNVILEIDAEFNSDGSFSYIMDTDEVEDAITDTFSTVLGWFIGTDVSVFLQRIIESLLQESIQGTDYSYIGTYSTNEYGIITAVAGNTYFYFGFYEGVFVQVDEEGYLIAQFKKV